MVEYSGKAYSRKLLESIFSRRLIRTRLLWPLPPATRHGNGNADAKPASQSKSNKVVVPAKIANVLQTISALGYRDDAEQGEAKFLRRLRRNFNYKLSEVRKILLSACCVCNALRAQV